MKMEFKIGNRKRTFNLNNISKIVPIIDITKEMEGRGDHPEYALVKSEIRKNALEFLEEVRNVVMEKYLHLFRDILKNNNSIYLIISILILFIIGKKSNITFFDFSDIIKKYTSCFRKSKITICIVFVLPIILAI